MTVVWEDMDSARREPFFATLKRDIVDRLALAPGDAALDVGCGTGEDVVMMADGVGPTGLAIGIDCASEMIDQAQRRFPDLEVKFQLGDAARLPFRDDAFAACRTERTLQHVEDPSAVVREVWRVLRTGGRFVAAEPDWTTTSVVPDDPPIGDVILARWTAFNRHPSIGRDLIGLLRETGFSVPEVEGRSAIYRSFTDADQRYPLVRAARHAAATGLVSDDDAGRWIDSLESASAAGTFLFSVTVFLASAVKEDG